MPTSPLSDEALVQQIKEGADPRALGILLQRHQATVVQACHRLVKDRDTAQDLSQEVFMRVVIRIEEFNGRSSFSTWLHSIVQNRCVDHLRRTKRPMLQDLSRRIIDTLAEELEDEAEKLTLEQVLTLLEEVDGQDKYLLLLKYEQGFTAQEIRQATGLSEGTIKMRLHRAKARLRKLLSQVRQ